MIDGNACLADTHRVENQSQPLQNYNLFSSDNNLGAIATKNIPMHLQALAAFGHSGGRNNILELGHLANHHKPQFRSHDRFGNRVDQIDFHPAYHQLMQRAIAAGLHSMPWTSELQNPHQHRAALTYLQSQIEAGHGCPITMTFASVPTLRKQPDIANIWIPLVTSNQYDGSNRPWFEKQGATVGMAMTEKQGGSDVRANTTRAAPVSQAGGGQLYRLVGHKFFVSAPMCDGFLTLAQAAEGLSCFLVPRWAPDGSKNPVQIQQLKNKMGNVSNASSEVELRGALGWLVGDEGRGVANILEMVALTRFDCMIGSSAGQRQATAQAIFHCQQRKAFGKKLVDQPLMQNVLADLALESEASLALTMRIAKALDNSHQSHDQLLARIGTAVGKYWICKRSPGHAYEAMECIGGSGAMEDGPMPRLYREAPINAIWEGSGNVQCLDLLRALHKHPETLAAAYAEIETAAVQLPLLKTHLQQLQKAFNNSPEQLERQARQLMEGLALGLQAAALVGIQSPLTEAFCLARLNTTSNALYGALNSDIDCKAIINWAAPAL